jgi:hypothetical protein
MRDGLIPGGRCGIEAGAGMDSEKKPLDEATLAAWEIELQRPHTNLYGPDALRLIEALRKAWGKAFPSP